MSTAPKAWGEEYERERPLYERFSVKLAELLAELLDAVPIDYVQIEKRAKTVMSFVDKVARKGAQYTNPLSEVTDLAGVRVIVYYLEDVARVGNVIRREFEVDESNTTEAPTRSPDQFGYVSVHYVVQLADNRTGLGEWRGCGDLKAEIQVRTALQHAWGAIDHTLRYKSGPASGLPPVLARDLFRLSALLELADKEFSSLRKATEEQSASYSAQVGAGELAIPLDALALDAYLSETGKDDEWVRIALEQGFVPVEPEDYAGSLEYLQGLDRQYLLLVLREAGFETVDALDQFLDEAQGWGPDVLRQIADNSLELGHAPEAWATDLLTILALIGTGMTTETLEDPAYVGTDDPWHWGAGMRAAIDQAVAAHHDSG